VRIDLVGTTADFRAFGPRRSLPINHLLCENSRTAGRIGEDGLAASEWEARLTFGPPLLSPSGWPKSEVAAMPAKMLEATSTVALPAPRNQPRVPNFSAVEIAGLLARGDWLEVIAAVPEKHDGSASAHVVPVSAPGVRLATVRS
jgi:hypothetical protein